MKTEAPDTAEGGKRSGNERRGRKVQFWVCLTLLLLVLGGIALPGLLHKGPD